MEPPDESRERALVLLQNNHNFPGPFDFRVVVRPGHQATIVAAIRATIGSHAAVTGVQERPSRTGKYLALRIGVTLDRAEQALTCWDVLKTLDGVVTVM